MPYQWGDSAWEDYAWWQTEDRKTLKRINILLKEIARTGGSGATIGKPERLRNSPSSLCSARIDAHNRLVYKVQDGVVYIVSCRGHYEER